MSNDHNTNDDPLASRSGTSNPLGKRTEDVRGKVPYAIKEQMLRDLGDGIAGSESELVGEIIMLHYLGKAGVLKLHEDRLNRMARLREGIGQPKDAYRPPVNPFRG